MCLFFTLICYYNQIKKNGNMGKKLKLMTINHTRSLRYIFKCLDKKNQLFIYVEVNKQKNQK